MFISLLYLSIVESEKFFFAFCSSVNSGLIVSTSLIFNFEFCFDSRIFETAYFPHLETESESKVEDIYNK